MLKIENLWVDIDGKDVLKEVTLHIPQGETHILFGKNGSGKSTLLMTFMGSARYRVKEGSIRFQGQDITHIPINQRARMGLGIALQRPPTIRGVKMRDVLAAWMRRAPGLKSSHEALPLEAPASAVDISSVWRRA